MSIIERFSNMKKTAEGGIVGSIMNDPDLLNDCSLDKRRFGEDILLYFNIFEGMYAQGFKDFDEVSIYSYIKNSESIMKKYEDRGGYKSLLELKNIISADNFYTYVDTFNKVCLLGELKIKGFNIESNFDNFEKMTTSQVFDWFEYQLNSVSADVGSDVEFETLEVTDTDLNDLLSGSQMGIPYGEHSPLLNYMTLGLPKDDLTIIGSYVNQGKSSFVSANMVFPLAKRGVKVGILANEMSGNAYKQLLIQYVLIHDLHIYDLTRKKIKMGKFQDKMEIMKEVQKIIKEVYSPNIIFGKTFDYDSNRTKKILKKWSKIGIELAIYDTLKSDVNDKSSWESLINSTRILYQLASKEKIAIVAVMQLALATNARRILDLDVLAGGKQASEVASEVIFFRTLHTDERTGEINEVKCYNYIKDEQGKYTNKKEYIILDPEKEYRIMFLAKSRNDRTGQAILYQFDGYNNNWIEKGYCQCKSD